MVDSAILTVLETSMPIILTVWLLKVIDQQVPHAGELNPVMAGTPPMCGNPGNESNVVKFFVKRPFDPVEHATVASDWLPLS